MIFAESRPCGNGGESGMFEDRERERGVDYAVKEMAVRNQEGKESRG